MSATDSVQEAAEAVDPPWRDGFGPIPKTEAGIKAAIGGRLQMEWDRGEQTTIGRDPRTMSVAELESLGHRKRPLLSAIRQNCIDCAGGSPAEVRRCAMVACPFCPYRMGTDPFTTRGQNLSAEQRHALAERMQAVRRKHGEFAENSPDQQGAEAAEASGGSEIPAGSLPAGIAGADQG